MRTAAKLRATAVKKVKVNSVDHMTSAPRSANASGKSGAGNGVVLFSGVPPTRIGSMSVNSCFATFFGISVEGTEERKKPGSPAP